jgi:hypothetical protein
LYSSPPTSRDYIASDQREKPYPRPPIDAVSGEIANKAIVNLALKGDTRSYQIISAWWAHHHPAIAIAKHLHCSLASVYNYRLIAIEAFWPEYLAVKAKNRRTIIFLTA